jgi:D-alanyl-lipoteichoic acid acyltransferase DltB (MBOAT superfamily)
MLLSSSAYFVFLIAVFLLYWPLSRFRSAALAVLLFANYFFYAKWGLFYLALIPAASLADYLIGRGLGAARRRPFRLALVSTSVVINLGVLAAFKYMPLFLGTWASWTGQPPARWDWTFPLGISFYVFQSLTYTIDLYRRDGKPVRSLLTHFTAVSFFPTILSGPITRVLALAPQLEKPGKALADADSGKALFLIGLGLAKKFLIADYLADNLVNRVFDTPALYTATETLIGVYGYALQLYYDFSGYTDIAIGSALLLGLKLPPNFNRPYAATGVADFWRRWHITLSNWLRDYLYFSLPGLRSKWKAFTYGNLVLTMALGGLWHGASWTFLVWGLLHGFGLAVNHAWRTWRGKREEAPGLAARLGATVLTAHFVILAWIPFRASSMENAWQVAGRLASLSVSFANVSTAVWVVLGIAALGHYLPKGWYEFSLRSYARAPFYAQAALLAGLVGAIEFVAVTGAAPFLYTRF